MIHKCNRCGIDFETKGTKPRKYCSRECYSRSGRIEKKCKNCGDSFEVIKYRKNQMFCSVKCGNIGGKSNAEEMKKTMMNKYGVESPSQMKDFNKKRIRTLKNKYGDNYKEVLLEKTKAGIRSNHGVDFCTNPEKVKQTKLERYGDENYNNREKALNTIQEKHGSSAHPNVIKSTTKRSRDGSIGFKSNSYKKYLEEHGVENVSQIKEVREKKRISSLDKKYDQMKSSPFSDKFEVLFKREEYNGSSNYEKYPFKCLTCETEFTGRVRNGLLPRCFTCNPKITGTSKYEDKLYEFVLSIYDGELIRNDRKQIFPKELDIFLPEEKLAIEFNGLYWHSEVAGQKDKSYHSIKKDECENIGIHLIQINEFDWINKPLVVKSILKNYLGNTSKIYARKCSIKEVSFKDTEEFLKHNHIQGPDRSSIRYGLYYKDELVSVMTFGKSRYDKSIEHEMLRFCNKLDTSIVGGASRLFKRFISDHSPTSIISYSDQSYFTGDLYKKLGFIYKGKTPPNYHYINKDYNILISRHQFQKHMLSEKLDIFREDLTEWENMQLNGFDRIWNCGNKRFIWIT